VHVTEQKGKQHSTSKAGSAMILKERSTQKLGSEQTIISDGAKPCCTKFLRFDIAYNDSRLRPNCSIHFLGKKRPIVHKCLAANLL